MESELSSKTEGIGVPPALEKETGKGKNRIVQVLLVEKCEKNLRKKLRVSYEKARTTEQNAPREREAKKLQSDHPLECRALIRKSMG